MDLAFKQSTRNVPVANATSTGGPLNSRLRSVDRTRVVLRLTSALRSWARKNGFHNSLERIGDISI
jgi:hypothetical protein